jgi:hypothetical protein
MTAAARNMPFMWPDALSDLEWWVITAVIPFGFLAVWKVPAVFLLQAGALSMWAYGIWGLARWRGCGFAGTVVMGCLTYPAVVLGSNFAIVGLWELLYG